jgi:hypothetical protein
MNNLIGCISLHANFISEPYVSSAFQKDSNFVLNSYFDLFYLPLVFKNMQI